MQYYLNVIQADISKLPSGGPAQTSATDPAYCGGSKTQCTIPLDNGPGSWDGYHP